MDKRACVEAALRHEQPEATPYNIEMTLPLRTRLAEHWGADHVEEKLGNFLATAEPAPPDAWRELEPGVFQDEFGVVWDRTVDKDIGTVQGCALPEPTLRGYELPDPLRPERFANMPAFLEAARGRYVLSGIGFSLYERAWTLRGMANLMSDMLLNPGFVHELLDAICEWNLAVIDKLCELPIDAVRFGDDWGDQRGIQMGPDHWRTFIKPRLARMYARAHAHGKQVVIHSCGAVSSLFDELIEIGVNVFNPFQPEVMDVYEMKRKYGDRLSFYGGISTQKLLPFGTPDDVRREVKRALTELGHDGGYILAPAHATPKDVPLENLLALIETVQNQ